MARQKKKKNVKRKKPGKSKSIPAGRGRLFALIGIIYRLIPYLLIIALLFFAGKAVSVLLLDSSYFKVKRIQVSGDSPDDVLREISEGLQSKKGGNIFRLDIKACQYMLEKNYPELKDIVVQRSLPDTLLVTYTKRKPICQVNSGRYYLVSGDGTILPNPQIAKEPGLISVTGIRISYRTLLPARDSYAKGLEKAVSIIKEIEESDFRKEYQEIVQVNVYDSSNPVLLLKDRTRVELGEFSFKEKEPLLKEIIDELESKHKKARVIDLRFEDVIVIPE